MPSALAFETSRRTGHAPAGAPLWDEVWAEFDRRQPPPAVAPVGTGPRTRRRRRALPALAGVALALAAGLANGLAAPLQGIDRLLAALRRGDTAAIAEQTDWAALRPQLAAQLRRPAGPEGAGYLDELTEDVAAGLATPAGVLGLLRGHGGMGADWDRRSILPLGLTEWRLAVAAADGELTFTLSWRPGGWRIVGIGLPG